jgi:hypothetical protein
MTKWHAINVISQDFIYVSDFPLPKHIVELEGGEMVSKYICEGLWWNLHDVDGIVDKKIKGILSMDGSVFMYEDDEVD